MNEELRKEIEQLRREKTKTLRARYFELFGEESKSFDEAHLFRRIAWRLQALSEGDLSQRARHRPGRGRRSSATGAAKVLAGFGRRAGRTGSRSTSACGRNNATTAASRPNHCREDSPSGF